MAFTKQTMIYGRGGVNNYATKFGLATHSYVSADDTLATISGASYFPDLLDSTSENVKVEDLLIVRDSVGSFQTYSISSLSPITLVETVSDVESGSFALTLIGGFDPGNTQTVTYEKSGNIVTLRYDFKSLVQTGASDVITGIDVPASIRTTRVIRNGSRIVIDNSVEDNFQEILDPDGSMRFTPRAGGSFSGTGNLNFQEGCITYII